MTLASVSIRWVASDPEIFQVSGVVGPPHVCNQQRLTLSAGATRMWCQCSGGSTNLVLDQRHAPMFGCPRPQMQGTPLHDAGDSL